MRFDNSYYKISVLRLVFATLLLGTFVGAQGQEAFHRIFPSEAQKNLSVLGGTQLNDGAYVSLNILVAPDGNSDTSRTFIVTKHEKKGDIGWILPVKLTMVGDQITPFKSMIIQAANDSIYFTIGTQNSGTPNMIMGSVSSDGKLGTLKSVTTVENLDDDNIRRTHMIEKSKEGFFTMYNIDNNKSFNLSKYNRNGSRVFNKSFLGTSSNNLNLDQNAEHLSIKDANIAITGATRGSFFGVYITVLDTLANTKWSKSYRYITDTVASLRARDIVQLLDTTYVIVGNILKSPQREAYIVKTKKNGDVEWSKSISFGAGQNIDSKFVETNDKGEIIFAGINSNPNSNPITAFDFIIKLNTNGEVIWQKKYPRTNALISNTASMTATADGGHALFTNVLDDGVRSPSMIKIGIDGEIKIKIDGKSNCEEEIVGNIVFDNLFRVDTLKWAVSDKRIFDAKIDYKKDDFKYDVPALVLNPKSFCRKDPVNHLFKPRDPIPGATNYEWSTGLMGATQDSLRVMSVGDYSLTVTVGEKVCYVLCADVKLDNYPLPEVSMRDLKGNFCTNDKKQIVATHSPDSPGNKSYLWNTMDTTGIIEVPGTGTFMVTVTDNCDEQAVGTFTLYEFPKKITEVKITGSVSLDCYDGGYKGTLVALGNAVGGDVLPQKYLWNNGTTNSTLEITNDEIPKIYSVTVTDACNVTATAQTSISGNGDPVEISQINVSRVGLCDLGELRLNASTVRAGSKLTYLWSTGQNVPAIIIKTAGTYTVTVTDLCANTDTETIEVKSTDFAPEKIRFAKVFFPDALGATYEGKDSLEKVNVLLNRTFGPIDKDEYCIRGITDYEFYIYNRWGQTVFKTNEVEEEWDGKIDGKQSASDTYIYLARYKVNGVELVQKGDVDLIR